MDEKFIDIKIMNYEIIPKNTENTFKNHKQQTRIPDSPETILAKQRERAAKKQFIADHFPTNQEASSSSHTHPDNTNSTSVSDFTNTSLSAPWFINSNSIQSQSTEYSAPDMIWVYNDVKPFFKVHKLWPSFIGTRLSREEELNGALPVLIWNEQKKYLEYTNSIKEGSSNIAATIKTKKRKREDEDSDDNDNGNSRRSRSRTFLSLFTFMETHIGRFINSIKSVFFSSPTQMQIHNEQNIAPSLTVEALDTLDTLESPPPPNITESYDDKHKRNKLSLPDLVFQDLNRKGYFVGPGDVYGADYSIYTGNPSDTHSIATGNVIPEIY